MENKENIKERLEKQGYLVVQEYNELSDKEFPEHDHEKEQLVVVLRGSIAVEMDGKDYLLGVGDELRIPAKMKHTAKIGPEGCEAIMGEKE